MKRIAMLVTLFQAFLALRVIARLVATAGGSHIERRSAAENVEGVVTVLVPVLNEAARLPACLAGVTAQGPEVAEILIIDGGSTDDTQAIASSFAARDDRIRLIDATPLPADVNGKAYGIQVGVDAAAPRTDWLLTIDADVRLDPMLVRSLLAHAGQEGIGLLSVATRQRLSGSAEGILHPAMLATLVYRFGIPGHATTDVDRVQANGQCFLIKRDVLMRAGGFTGVFDSACEDVTLARTVAANGDRVGFYEADDLVSVEMYAGWRDAWQNWSRSLPMRDRFTGRSCAVGLGEVTLVQALPLYLAPSFRIMLGRRHPATVLNLALLCVRAGVLAGMARAYERRPLTYWLSPLADLPVAVRIWQMSRRRRHRWRGRTFVTGALT
jgi:dolichol-phosphate mannosyltransferase